MCLLRGTFCILHSAHTVCLCVLCGSENKQRLFHCTALTDWLVFITETECVYCAVRSTFFALPTQCVYVLCEDLRTNSDYFTVQHWLVGFVSETECVYCAVRSTFYVQPTQCVYVFCVDLRTNSDYFTVQHWLVGFYNWDGVCLLRGTSWSFN